MKVKTQRPDQRGSTLILALTLCGLGTLGVVATASIIQARGMEAERASDYTARWTRLQNSKALARQVIYKKFTTSDNGPTGIESYTLPDGWGEISVQSFSGAAMTSTSTRSNKTGAVPFESFTQDVEVGMGDGTYLDEYEIQIKSGNPMLGGDLLVVQKSNQTDGGAPEVTGDFRIKGRALLNAVETSIGNDTIQSDGFLARADGSVKPVVKTSDGAASVPLNFSYVTRTSSEFSAGSAAFDGRVSVIDNAETPHNSYLNKIIATGLTVEFDGDVPYAKGLGPDTRLSGPSDGLLIGLLTGLPQWGLIRDALNAEVPVSSDVLRAVIAANPPSGTLKDILEANAPLPGDILGLIDGSTILSQNEKDEILESSPIIARSDGGGNVIILPTSDIPAHIKVQNASSVIFQGESDPAKLSAAEALNAVIVVIQQKASDSNQLSLIEFQEENSRRLVVAVEQETPNELAVPFTGSTAFPEWRMLMELESAPVTMNVGAVSSVKITGGIRTDKKLGGTGGTVTLVRETDPGNLSTLASRDAWLEEFRK